MTTGNHFLVCFALPEEARPFQRRTRGRSEVRVLLTGIGQPSAEKAVRLALAEHRPALVLSCGFAGGLDPALDRGAVVFETDDPETTRDEDGVLAFVEALVAAGARRIRFHCGWRIAVTAIEKHALRLGTGADAVEMESGAIRSVCRVARVPCVTVRIISDTAQEDLPVDFNRLMKPDLSLDLRRLLCEVARAPRLIRPLLRLQRHSRSAAGKLAEVLDRAMGCLPP